MRSRSTTGPLPSVDLLYKRTVRPYLIQPCFLIHHPAALVPLAKRLDQNPNRLAMFQVVANGWSEMPFYRQPEITNHRSPATPCDSTGR